MRRPLCLCLVLVSAALGGCVSDQAYRREHSVLTEKLRTKDFDPTQPNIATREWPYVMTFVEFGDDARMLVPEQLTRTLEQIDVVRGSPPSKSGDRPMVAVFIHGWKNNAAEGTGNVWGFRQVLAGLSSNQDAPVLGIYVAWRGATLNVPILKELTFFERHPKSQSVGAGEMVEALRRISRAVKAPNAASGDIRLVLVGHSFGGAVLEAAVTPQLHAAIDEAQKATGPERRVRWPADLVVYLNEAQEAERSYPLIEEMSRVMMPRPDCTTLSKDNPFRGPAVISISSRSDYATRGFFPVAQLIGRIYNRPQYQGSDPLGAGKRRLYYSTTAHLTTLQSHRIGRRDDPAIQSVLAKCPVPVLESNISMFENDEQYVLVENPGAVNTTPYWVTWMPSEIVPDHSPIFTQVFRDYLVSLLLTATGLPSHNELKPQAP
jgi:hypothetical protein